MNISTRVEHNGVTYKVILDGLETIHALALMAAGWR